MSATISICIPTYQRPQLLEQAVRSALSQTHPDVQVIVSDDSTDQRTEDLISAHPQRDRIRYVRNKPSLRQAANVNRLFALADGPWLVLLHDDDVLLPTAVEDMLASAEANPQIDMVFGKQQIINAAGEVDAVASEELNRTYHRTPDRAGEQPSAMWSALVAQLPNDGYLIKTQLARKVGYRADVTVGDACDYDFGLRLGLAGARLWFVDRYTCQYRHTESSVSTNNNYAHLSYGLVEALPASSEMQAARMHRLQHYAPAAISAWLRRGDRAAAWRIYRSPAYPWSRRLSTRGLLQAALMATPAPLAQKLLRMKRM
jgi:GT2 family glycosyltransferase